MSEDAKQVGDRLMLRFSLVDSRYCILITTYTPTMINKSEKIYSFYDQVARYFLLFQMQKKIVLFGPLPIIPGQRFLVNLKQEKLIPMAILLLSICIEHKLVISNIDFKHKQIHKNFWI